ncbi:ABC transporter ATP-binding protein [Sphingomonas sp. HDW15A]|uniref:ABC transporter ATP-binding protein n=1 Tax=Sphingomonas sp. HDW15A TaxID=2714942 RepID=UPI00140E8E4B|nr:ABC transporter ATP-binding protein [Sphingomonas sp. HDW15A]QIK96049.1 ABC transporter ATP-binding protein [Sphingomonas sp. HDW15A]
MTSLASAHEISIPGRIGPLSLSIQAAELIAVVGPNGGGKTSLLRALAQVEEASGEVEIGGEVIAAVAPNRRTRLIGLLPASRDTAWPVRVRDLLTLGLSSHDSKAIEDEFEAFELAPLAGRTVDRLSTGERSRVLLARMFAADPALMLLDEPLANLDPYWVRRLLDRLQERKRDASAATLATLHDLAQLHHFDRVIGVENGSIAFDGPPDCFLTSVSFENIFRISAAELGLQLS